MTTSNPFLARFDGQPSLVAPEMRSVFEACLQQAASFQARLDEDRTAPKMAAADDDFWFADDDWRAQYRPYVVRDGILHVPVKGVLLHDFPYQYGSRATGYEYIWQAVKRGQSDANVRGIAFILDTPGGMVAGCFEVVDRIHAIESRKPVRAFAMESAYSAGYAIASAADSITVSKTGGVGSIGVVTVHLDVSSSMEKYGIKVTFIHAGKHKVDGNPFESLKPEVKARIQARIDELYSVFVSTVARNRAMDEKVIRDTEALTFTATEAVSNKLADAVGSLDDALVTFVADLSLPDEDEEMSDKSGAVDQAAVDAARASGHTAGFSEGAAAERARINAILGSDEGKARPKAAMSTALKTGMSAEEAIGFLGDLPEEKATAPVVEPNPGGEEPKGKKGAVKDFLSAMERSDNPNLGATHEEETGEQMSRGQRALLRVKGPKKAA